MDNVNHPAHYESGPSVTIECIDVARHLNFCRGNAFKYVWRCGKKGNVDQAIEDLEKAIWYLYDGLRYSDAKCSNSAIAVFSLINFSTSDMFETERYNALSSIIYNKDALIPIDAMKGILKNRLMEKKQNENR
ncbi:MAG: hypothetical protein BWY69_00888 [Planctomycetes bacterium ADurb.Bin401]|nr:MAG: hypothetical protein BWY69_00888 [Planctomycetes bacterium ADurb.Bin401]